jgi:membrane protein
MVWAVFPALAIIVIIVALLLGPAPVLEWLLSNGIDLPESFNAVVTSQLGLIAERSHGMSTLTLLGAFAFSLWSGMRGTRALIAGLNLVYNEPERRSFWHRQAVALGLCVLGGAFVLGALMLILGLAGPRLASPRAPVLLALAGWPVLIVATLLLLSVAYRYGPCRRLAKWRWVTWGAAVSATIWVMGSALLSYYAAHYAQFNPVLGSLGLVMIFMFWCYLTSLIVLLGAQINKELERHTDENTCAGEPRPTGKRGAVVAHVNLRR